VILEDIEIKEESMASDSYEDLSSYAEDETGYGDTISTNLCTGCPMSGCKTGQKKAPLTIIPPKNKSDFNIVVARAVVVHRVPCMPKDPCMEWIIQGVKLKTRVMGAHLLLGGNYRDTF